MTRLPSHVAFPDYATSANSGHCVVRTATQDQGGRIVSSVEAVFEFGEVAWNILAVDGTMVPVMAASMLPKEPLDR
jgi:hypothetical protein